MFKFINKYLLNSKSDQGSALVLVLMLVIFLGLLLTSVAFLNQSSQSALAQSAAQSDRRNELINGALQQSLKALSVNPVNNATRRWGVDTSTPNSDGSAKCSDKSLPDYVQTIKGLPQTIKIECTEAQYSGQIFPLASFVLTGTSKHLVSGVWSDCTNASTSSRCVTGVDGGLDISANGSGATNAGCTATNTSRLLVSGGIFNASGAWKSVDCSTLEFKQNGTARPSITQPDTAVIGHACPAATVYESTQTCACPASVYLNTTSTPGTWNEPCSGNTGKKLSDLDPTVPSSNIKAYLDSVSSGLGDPVFRAGDGFSASQTGFAAGACTGVDVPAIGGKAVVFKPGIINNALLADLNTMTGTAAGNCSGAGIPIIFTTGVYRFVPDALTSQTWTIGGGANIIGGTPLAGATDCDQTKPGVQLQFAGASFLKVTLGSMRLCADGTKPVLAAPTKNPSTTFFWDASTDGCKSKNCPNHTAAFFTKSGGNNSANCDSCFVAHGLVFAPAGWADISLNGKSNAEFGQGAIFRALTISTSGSVLSSGDVAPSPPFDGDRLVQLRFWDMTNGAIQKDLGMIQVVIKDYFGRRIASGYKIVAWRVLW